MSLLSYDALSSYWSTPMVEVNVIVFFNLLGALFLGLLVGYACVPMGWYVWLQQRWSW